jgi:hypothetical protein
MALTQKDILDQLDRIKNSRRGYFTPGDYTDFLPSALPSIGRPDTGLLQSRSNMIADQSKGQTQLTMIEAQNRKDYEDMVRAQQALQRANKSLKRAERLQALSAQYNGSKKPIKINATKNVTRKDTTDPYPADPYRGNVNTGKGWHDPTPFNINAGLGHYKWNGFNLTVNKSIADNFLGLLNALKKTGYNVTSLGSYANRNIAGTNTKSLHAYGLAIDINPGANPVAYNQVITNLPKGIGRLAAKYGLAWGGQWNGSKKDPMHFSKPWFGTK